jgi:Alpha-L-arabinofuranosidase
MEVMMRDIPSGLTDGVSLHYYTVPDNWGDKGAATVFTEADYYRTVRKAWYMNELVSKHATVMDRYDPQKRIGLIVDEWGNWFNVEPGTNPGFLYQQNTLRDAITAGLHLNIFNNHADRVQMANIAQLVNVLQALFLTDGEQMLLTPTYHVFDMYKVHQQATLIPVVLSAKTLMDNENQPFPQVSASASIDAAGVVHISLVNTDLANDIEISCVLNSGRKLAKQGGQIITSKDIRDYNSFENPNRVVLYDFEDYTVKDNRLTMKLPAKSVVTIALK